MPTPQWKSAPAVIEQLLSEPYRAEFFQAVSLIELWLEQHGVGHGTALLEYLRFPNRLSLSFPPSQIAALTVRADAPVDSAAALLAALRARQLDHICITPAFMGLLGGNGTLPLHHTQRIAAYERDTGDSGPRAFLDLFSNRSVTLAYQAWTMHRPGRMRDAEGRDCLLPMLLAFAGVRPHTPHKPREVDEADEDDLIAEETAAFYAAQFGGRRVSASVVAGLLSEYFGVPFALEQLVGAWIPLAPEHQSRLGVANVTLGAGMVLGKRVYSRDKRARLRIGPLDKASFERFIPRSSASRALERLLGMFCGVGMTFEVRVVLRRQDVRGVRLGAGARLGIDAFLLSRPAGGDRDDLAYLLHP